jgi:predicted ArsR family transcriptional regulator
MLHRNKASLDLDNQPAAALAPHDRLLFLLKTGGPNSTAALARKLGITVEAARQQLLRLQEQALVEATSEIRGRGRPRQLWNLTAKANGRFPDSHPALTAQLIETIRSALGERALDRVIAVRGEELVRNYTFALKDVPDLADRMKRLVSLRNAEGYMAESRQAEDGYLLIENHCPICAASGSCLKLCRSELELFSKVLGPDVRVEREEHIVNGSRRCVYHIRPCSRADNSRTPRLERGARKR